MTMNKPIKSLLFLVIIITIFASCKTQQATRKPSTEQKGINVCELVQKSYDAQPQFTTMNISKMSMSVNYGDMVFSCKSSIRIATDSIISISIQPALGIEMFRAEFTPQHFTIYNKLKRQYSQNSYEYIKLKWGIDVNYKAIEALFSHQLFTPTTIHPAEICKNFEIKHYADTTTIQSTKPIGKYTQIFDISTINNRLTMTGLNYEQLLVLAITYSSLKEFDKITFPQEVKVQTTMIQPTSSAILNIEKVKFNDPLTISPINISRYTKVGLIDIIKQ